MRFIATRSSLSTKRCATDFCTIDDRYSGGCAKRRATDIEGSAKAQDGDERNRQWFGRALSSVAVDRLGSSSGDEVDDLGTK